MATYKAYPFTWSKCTKEEQDEYDSIYVTDTSVYHSMIKSSPMNLMMPAKFEHMGEKIWNFTPRKDDIWIVTYPKCGTTLTQELTWQIVNGVQLDSEESKKPLFVRSPFIEAGCLRVKGDEVKDRPDPIDYAADQLKSPRIIKTHLPISMLPPKILETSKVLYVSRNVKDACVSYFYMDKLMKHHGLKQDYDFEDYAMKVFMKGKPIHGSYWEHLNDGWKYRNHKNFKLAWYEDMIDDLPKVIGEIADFVGYKISKEQTNKLTEYLDIDNFRKRTNAMTTKFFRKGKVGDWMNHFKDESKLAEFDQWIAKNNSENIPIKYEL